MAIYYSAFHDFSIAQNPNGVWTYQANGVPYASSFSATGYDYWTPGSTPEEGSVLFNTSGSTVDIGTISLQTGVLGLVPGQQTDATVSFTAPTRAYYSVAGVFAGMDTAQAGHLVDVTAAGRTLFESYIDTYGQSAYFTLPVLLLNAGDTINFVTNGDGVGNMATSLTADVTQAANYSWKRGISGDFDTAARWKPAGVPGDNDNVTVSAAGTYTITSSADHWLVRLAITNEDATLAITGGMFRTQLLVNHGSIAVGSVDSGAGFSFDGKATNTGTITLAGDGGSPYLDIGADTSLQGGGTVVLGGSGNAIVGSIVHGRLNNVDNFITGTGHLGLEALQLTNGADGVIEADGGRLRVATIGQIVNSGIFRATAGSTLSIENDVLSKSGARYEADGAGASIVFEGVTLLGRMTLAGTDGGFFAIGAGLTTMDRNLTIDSDLTIDAAANGGYSELMLEGATINTGTMTLTSGGIDAALLSICDVKVNLTGGGSIVLAGDPAYTGIVGTTSRSQLVNYDNTIEGAGYIGQGSFGAYFRVINQASGTFDANVSGEALVIDTPAVFANYGTMKATNGGTLTLRGTIDAETGSLIAASGGGNILLDKTLMSGDVTMEADAGSAIVVGAGSASLTGLISLSGDVVVDAVANGATTDLMLKGRVTNSGTIAVTGPGFALGDTGSLSVGAGSAYLLGGGSVVLSGGAATIAGTAASSKLINIDNTIEGEGTVGGSLGGPMFAPLTIVNQQGGTIDANVASVDPAGGFLFLNAGFGSSSNAGTLQASNGGKLVISGQMSFEPTGVLKTVGATSSVLLNMGLLANATLDASAGGAIVVASGQSGLGGTTKLLGGEIAVRGSFDGISGVSLILTGTFTNQGVVSVTEGFNFFDPGNPYAAQLAISGTTRLQGGGSIDLSGSPGFPGNPGTAAIAGFAFSSSAPRLYNVDNTIEGAGALGARSVSVINQAGGTIEADVSGKTLLIDTGAYDFINQGTLQATNGGILTVASAVEKRGFGVIDGGTLEFQSSANIAVTFSSNGGTLEVDDGDIFKGSVKGFADGSTMAFTDIDFADVSGAFASNAAHTSGVFTLTDGTDNARLTLFGQYASAFTTAPSPGFVGFVLSDDGTANHGTLVTYHGP